VFPNTAWPSDSGKSEEHHGEGPKEGLIDKIKDKIHGDHDDKGEKKKKKEKKKKDEHHHHDGGHSSSDSDSD
ncbi:hypothetical protein, partial [Escherichia coli]|uniref:hypothetical protein n=1 Tax=Escherichia coli TaxID=562 RepID=UPI0020BE92B1